MGIDWKYKLIRKIETDTVRTHDSQFFDDALGVSGAGRDVQADRGYPSAGRDAWLKESGPWKPIQRKGHRNTQPSGCQ